MKLTKEKKPMGRPLGSRNKSACVGMKLKRLNELLGSEAVVMISRAQAEALTQQETDLIELASDREMERKESTAPLTIRKMDFTKK